MTPKTFVFLMIVLLLGGFDVVAQETTHKTEDRSVQIVKRVPPKYPTLALAKKTEGWVKVAFTITTEGHVEDIVVVESEPAKVFDYAAVEAVSQFKFLAPIKDGELVSQRATQVIEFAIPDRNLSNMAFFGGFLENLNKAQGIAQQSIYGQSDVILLVKDIRIESKIKTHKPTLNQLILNVIPDLNGFPESVKVVLDDFADKDIEVGVPRLKKMTLAGAQIASKAFSGYYNPIFIKSMAKNIPPSVFSIMEAKSMPIPDYSHEITLKARLTIDKQGQITDIKEANLDGEPAPSEFMTMILNGLVFEAAFKDFKPVKDTVDFTMVFSLVQKSAVRDIKDAWLNSLKPQLNSD